MPRIHGEVLIARPLEEVFDFVLDERNEPKYNPEMKSVEKLTGGPIAAGTRFRAEMAGKGRPIELEIELTDVERPARLTSVTRLPMMEIHGVVTFAPAPAGTFLRWDWDLRPRGMMRLFSPLMARMGRRQESRNWERLRKYLESAPGLASQSSGLPNSD